MKILFVGDVNGVHSALATELRARGHKVVLLTPEPENCHQDTIHLAKGKGLFAGMRFVSRMFSLLGDLQGYDVVQLINPQFLPLRTGKIRYFFNELKRTNGSVCLTLADYDPVVVKGCSEDDVFEYSEFRVGEQRTEYVRRTPGIEYKWLNGKVGDHCRFIYENVDAAIATRYECYRTAQKYIGNKLHYAGHPVNVAGVGNGPDGRNGKIRIFLPVTTADELRRGHDRLSVHLREYESRHAADIEFEVCRDLCHDTLYTKIKEADAVVDGLYNYSPSDMALRAMHMGKFVIGSCELSYLEFIGHSGESPILNLRPDDAQIRETLETVRLDLGHVHNLGAMSKEFVKMHCNPAVIADRFMRVWESL